MKQSLFLLLIFTFSQYASAYDSQYDVIQVYSQDELNHLVNINQHLQRVKADDCQLVEDIKAHALKIKEPAYTYLWGDMLAWGVCVERDARLGMYYIKQSAKQGLLPAIEQLGRYYERGTLVEANKERAIIYYREAALQGFLNAQFNYVRMLIDGYGSPVDYEDAYRALFLSIIDNAKLKRKSRRLLSQLAEKMPENVVTRARKEVM
ncbi:tetratricopeptide repeat protein [Psychromonas antarctica]|uniref:tetratricopeptide repeat protein n=1 Tax=Psychromonas antarctica TaxID=67573 RepID=UPI001EE9146C|nr:tetratricopeptide repeat protein [Psychromonas antarctica]MCG6200265.1 sel1 repeat family protein [Psychromonas antarctica]